MDIRRDKASDNVRKHKPINAVNAEMSIVILALLWRESRRYKKTMTSTTVQDDITFLFLFLRGGEDFRLEYDGVEQSFGRDKFLPVTHLAIMRIASEIPPSNL